jgi:hypothetical protein
MGYGDEIIATGLARGMHERGKLAAFGDGRQIRWGPWCKEMFANNPNIAPPGSESRKDLEWIDHYKGSRKYNRMINGRWEWNYSFRVTPGQFYFSDEEQRLSNGSPWGFIAMEPNVPWQKSVAPNKDWGEENYQALADRLRRTGRDVVQFLHKNSRRKIKGAIYLESNNFRNAISVLRNAAVYVGPEGGMHHASAAVGIKAVVLFGGFIPPQVVGYDGHVNLTGGAEACGNINECAHCRIAMSKISVEQVEEAALSCL